MLGTGYPRPDPKRMGPSLAIVVKNHAYIVDAGPGVVRRAEEAFRNGVKELEGKKLKCVFLTHLHSDHTLGLPDLIYTPWTGGGRTQPIEIYGPRGVARMVKNITAAFKEDIRLRISGLEHANKSGWKTRVNEIKPGIIYSDARVKITAFKVDHGGWKHAYGFKFVMRDKTIVVSGDTRPCAEIMKHAMGCDILVHEVYAEKKFKKFTKHWKKYCRSFHTSTSELAKIANITKPKILVLNHTMPFGDIKESQILLELKKQYKGKIMYPDDLDVIM